MRWVRPAPGIAGSGLFSKETKVAKEVKFAELKVTVFVDPSNPHLDSEEDTPLDDAVENLRDSIQAIEWEGLSHHEGVRIEVKE